MSRKIAAAMAVVAALSLSACKGDSSTNGEEKPKGNVSVNTEEAAKDLSNIVKTNKLSSKDAKVTGKIDVTVKAPKANGSLKGDFEFSYDADTKGMSAKFKGNGDLPKSALGGQQINLEAYGKENSGAYDLYLLSGGNWLKTTIPADDVSKVLDAANSTPTATPSLDLSTLKKYANIEKTEKGGNLIIKVTPTEEFLKELVSSAAADGVKLDENSLEGHLEITVDKKSYDLKSLKATAKGKTDDGKGAADFDLELNVEDNPDVSIAIPDEAKNATPIPFGDNSGSTTIH